MYEKVRTNNKNSFNERKYLNVQKHLPIPTAITFVLSYFCEMVNERNILMSRGRLHEFDL